MPSPTEKLERIHALSEIRIATRELYKKYDSLSDDAVDNLLNSIQEKIQTIRIKVQDRRTLRGNPVNNNSAPPTP